MAPVHPPNHRPDAGRNGLAVASLVLGIVSIPLCFAFVPAVLAVVFGAIALGQIRSEPAQAGRGQAIAGLVLGAISLALVVLAVALVGTASIEFDSSLLVLR